MKYLLTVTDLVTKLEKTEKICLCFIRIFIWKLHHGLKISTYVTFQNNIDRCLQIDIWCDLYRKHHQARPFQSNTHLEQRYSQRVAILCQRILTSEKSNSIQVCVERIKDSYWKIVRYRVKDKGTESLVKHVNASKTSGVKRAVQAELSLLAVLISNAIKLKWSDWRSFSWRRSTVQIFMQRKEMFGTMD